MFTIFQSNFFLSCLSILALFIKCNIFGDIYTFEFLVKNKYKNKTFFIKLSAVKKSLTSNEIIKEKKIRHLSLKNMF